MTEEKNEQKKHDIDLRGLGVEGKIRFNIKADDTPGNKAIHDGFREFCKAETDNNYTQGLRKLLEYYQSDFKIENIWEKLRELEARILSLEGSNEKDDEEKKNVNINTFGGDKNE